MMCINQQTLPKNGSSTPQEECAALRGLNDKQIESSREKHGANRMTKAEQRGFWSHFFSNLGDPVIRILLAALALNLLLMFRESDWVETVGIAVSVLLATLISTLSETGSEKAFARLQAQSAQSFCRVRRASGVCVVPWEEVVVGDFVLLGAGENIPADGVLLQGAVRVDQTAMTGESREVQKHAGGERRDAPDDAVSLYRGCAVLSGEGVMRVSRVGDATFLGGISREVQQQTRESPLRLRLAKLAGQISVVGYVAAALVAAAYLFHAFLIDSGFSREIMLLKLSDFPYLLSTLLHALTLGLTVIVVAVPEGLPMMIAVVLSANTRRMVRDHVLVRKPAGIEAAGSMNLLFTDKTGTLTAGRLSVGTLVFAEEECSVAAFFSRKDTRGALLAASVLCNATAQYGQDGVPVGGNATERALLAALPDAHRADAAGVRVLDRLPFDSARKYSATTVLLADGRRMTLLKGAPERLLRYTDRAFDGRGSTVPLDRTAMERRIRSRTESGERLLLLAAIPGGASPAAIEAGRFEGAVLLCAVTLADRLRPEVPGAVARLQGAGVQVVMITGDSRETAAAIAAQCGILNAKQPRVVTGEELALLSDLELRTLLPQLAVVARALPTDKSRLVRVAQEEDRVVGMTGDGINDAPALRRADIGFAMGSGSDVAKDAGDILILDDNLASIVRAVLYGRNIFKSIRKFITLQLTMNFCAVGISMIGPFIGVDAPVTVVQMLWINLIMDTLGGLAFAGEPPLLSCLSEPPKRRDTPILCRYMIDQIVLLGGYTVALFVFFLKMPTVEAQFRESAGDVCRLTAFFALFIFASVFNCFNTRSDRLNPLSGLLRNRPFLVIMAAILAVQLLFVYLGGSVLRTVPLLPGELGLTAAMALSVLPAEELRKLLWRWRGHTDRY